MRRAAVILLIVCGAPSVRAQYVWQQDNDGNAYKLVDVSQVGVGTSAPDSNTLIHSYGSSTFPFPVRDMVQNTDSTGRACVALINDIGTTSTLQAYQPGVCYAGNADTHGEPNRLIINGPAAGTGKYIDVTQAGSLVSQWKIGPYGGSELGHTEVFYVTPVGGAAAVSGYAAVGGVNADGEFGALAMVSSAPTQPPFNMAHSLNAWNPYGPICLMTDGSNIVNGTCAFELDASQNISATSLSGSGTRCVQVDNAGKFSVAAGACGSGAGTVTGVIGTAGRIVVTPSSPNPTVDLATFGTASTCTYATTVTDAYGRTTCTSGATPQPAGNYITALTHDGTAAGPGSVPLEVTGITDGTSVDHQVGASAWVNGQGVVLDGSGHLVTAPFQSPLVACTDYVSVGCQTGATDIGGSNATTTVIGIENDAAMRGDLLATEISAPSTPAAGKVKIYADTTFGNINAKGPGGTVNHGIQTVSCSASQWVNASFNSGNLGCSQPAFPDVSGSLACSQLPALTGNTTSTAGSCATKVVGITESGGASLPIGACSVDGEALVRVSGSVVCRLPNGDLSNNYTAPTVVALHDGGGSRHATSGTWNINQMLATDGSGNVVAVGPDSMVTKIPYYLHIPSLQAGDEVNRYLATSMSTQELSGGVVEYPAGFVAGHITAIMNITASSGTAASMDCFSTINGSGIAGTDFNFTPGVTGTGVTTNALLPTGSVSANDTYGEECIYNGTFGGGPFGATIAFTLELVLLP